MKIGVAGEWCSALELQNQAGLDYAAVQWLMLLPERLGMIPGGTQPLA